MVSVVQTSAEQLRQWLDAPEGSRFEFKEAKQSYQFDKLVDYCVALANEGGGKVILGATDKRPRTIVGTAAFPEPGRTEATLYQRLRRRVTLEEFHAPEGRVLIVHIPGRLPGTAWEINGRYLKRAGDELAPMTPDELRLIFAETEPDFSAQPCPGATLADLSEEAVADFRSRWAGRVDNERIQSGGVAETLTSAELMVDGQITYAALILFGTSQALGKYLAQAEVVFEYRSAESAGPAADRENFRLGFMLYHDQLWNRINLRNDRQSYQDGFFRVEVPTFDELTVREAVLNAVAHRDYRLNGSVFVRQFARRLEVVSPGGFPPGITADNILDQQNPRNRRLAEALNRCGLIERAGQGMNLMFERAVRQSKVLPDFSGTAAHEVRLTLEGVMDDPAFARFMERLGAERLRRFSTYDFLALDYVRREQTLPDNLRACLPGLIEVGAVESVGRGRGIRYMLSKALYAELGARGVYTRKRGLDHETNKELLVRHLRSQGDNGAPFADLQQVLPALSERSVRRLLSELRDEGRVIPRGRFRWARWFVVPVKN